MFHMILYNEMTWILVSYCKFQLLTIQHIFHNYQHIPVMKNIFHQSRIPNIRIFLTNICYGFFFNWQTEKKSCFGPIKNLFFFSSAQTEKNSGKKLVTQIGENIWWITCSWHQKNETTNSLVHEFKAETWPKCLLKPFISFSSSITQF